MGCGASTEQTQRDVAGKYTQDPTVISHGALSAAKPLSEADDHGPSLNFSTRARATCDANPAQRDALSTARQESAASPNVRTNSGSEKAPGALPPEAEVEAPDPLAEELEAVDMEPVFRELLAEALAEAKGNGASGVTLRGTRLSTLGQTTELSRADIQRIRQWADFQPPFEPIPSLEGSTEGRCPREYNLQQNQELLDAHYLHKSD